MKRFNLKKGFLIGTGVLIAFVLLGSFYVKEQTRQKANKREQESTASFNGKKVYYAHSTYAIDVEDPASLIGDADYTFVGKVLDTGVPVEYEVDKKAPPLIFTTYTVENLENINGSLPLATLAIQKQGGFSKKEDAYILEEEDTLPEKGQNYVFTVYVQGEDGILPNGTLLATGKNSTISLDTTIEKVAKASEKVKQMKKASQSQKTSKRVRSKLDKNKILKK